MELKIGKIKSIKSAEEKLQELHQFLKDAYAFERILLNRLSELKSKQTFEFPNGAKVQYNEITLVIKYYTEKGLGYSDDVDHFSEFMFSHESSPYNIRFLSDDSIKKFGIPHEIRDYYGKPKIFQKDSGEDYVIFAKKFKDIVTIGGEEESFGYQGDARKKEIASKRFINL